MLAQAQEMVVVKAIKDSMKDAIIAKLCAQCEDMYAAVMKNIQKESVRNLWESSWAPNIYGKQAIYNGLAQYYQSRVCNAEKSVGEEIARYSSVRAFVCSEKLAALALSQKNCAQNLRALFNSALNSKFWKDSKTT